MRCAGVRRAAAGALLAIVLPCMGAEPAFPPPPPEPEWHEPVPLEVTMTVAVDACGSAPEDPARINRFEPERGSDGSLWVEGWVVHNGSDSVDPDWARAWSHQGSLLLAYRYRPDAHPLEPMTVCNSYSKLRFEVPDLGTVPDEVTVHSGKFDFTPVKPLPRHDAPAKP